MSFLGDFALLVRAICAGYRHTSFVRPDYPHIIPVTLPPLTPVNDPPLPAPVIRREPKPPRGPNLTELKRDLLDGLADYLIYIKRLRKADPEAYRTYRRVGAFITRLDTQAHADRLEPGVVNRLPMFGAVSFIIPERKSKIIIGKDGLPTVPVRFSWMTKLDRPGHDCERRNGGTIYRCTSYFDDVTDKKMEGSGHGAIQQYLVHVDDDGTITPLRMLKTEEQIIRHKKGEGAARKGANFTVVKHQRWGLPDFGDDLEASKRADLIRWLFCFTMNFWVQAATGSMIRVTATKGNVVMPFVVDVLDTPGFFSDRDITITQTGVKKRIFHIVRQHVRASGQVVKLHFRGLRDFIWNGYNIKIVVPGRDAHDLADFTIAGVHEDVPPEERGGQEYFDHVADGLIADAIGAPLMPAEDLEMVK
jgi:hypothetical protein